MPLQKATGRTKTFYAREAILEYLDDLEDIYLAEKRVEDIRSGRSKTVLLGEMMKRYGMDGLSLIRKRKRSLAGSILSRQSAF
jgi:RHH-type rel operon transcriptional repressor/antitoxin RelB